MILVDHSLILMVISPIAAALIIKLFSRFQHSDEIRYIITFLGLFIPMVLLFFTPDTRMVYELGGWARPYGISLVLNGLSRVMVLITGIITLTTYVYYIDFLDQDPQADDYHFLYLFMTAGLYGVFLTGDLINRFIFFEMMILTTYVLLTFVGTKESLKASFRYFVIGTIASLMFLAGIGLTYFHTGYFDMGALSAEIPKLSIFTRTIIFSFFLVAVGIKLGIMPFHTWLPDAHVEAPTPMTAVLAALTVKTGGYILLKLFEIGFDTPVIQGLILTISIFTAIFGALISMKYLDMKRILAWLTISHVGIIGMVFSLWTPQSVGAGLLYFVNHSFYKGLLFLTMGCFAYLYGTSNIRKMPLLKSNVILSSTFFIGALAMIGIPPLNGFYSRWAVLTSVNNPIIYLVELVTGILVSASVIRIILLSSDERKATHKTLSEGMMAPLLVLAGLTIFGGTTLSFFLNNVIDPASISVFGEASGLMISNIEIRAIITLETISLLLSVVGGYMFIKMVKGIPSGWIEGTLSKVNIRDSVRYILFMMTLLLIFNVIYEMFV